MSQNFSGSRSIITFFFITAILLLLVYLSVNTNESKQEVLNIGITQWPGYEYLFIAKKQGFFEQVGLKIELVELSSLAAVRRAFERNKIDGMASSLVEVLEAYKYSNEIAQPVLAIDYSNGADEILATNTIESVKELKGKNIGVEAGSRSTYLVNNALEINNISQSEVVLIPMSSYALSKALKSGKVDAITSYPPMSLAIKKQLDVNVIHNSSSIQHKLVDVISINEKILKKHPDIHHKLCKAWDLTLEYVKSHPQESFSILTERLHMSINEFMRSMELIYLVMPNEQPQYFNQDGIIKNSLIEIGDIIFIHDDSDTDYSQFIINNYVH